MSTCRYFWTNLRRSVETGPVCPVEGAIGYWSDTTEGFFFLLADDYLGSAELAPSGEDGYNLLDTVEATVSPQATAQWVDLSQLGFVGVSILPVNQ